jgi:hypothetical protein
MRHETNHRGNHLNKNLKLLFILLTQLVNKSKIKGGNMSKRIDIEWVENYHG